MHRLISPLVLALAAATAASPSHADEAALKAAIAGDHRTPTYAERDQYRHPLETLTLFDVQPNHTVVEVWPGGGWYTEILAPYLSKNGLLIAAHYDMSDTQASYRPRGRERFEKKMTEGGKLYSNVKISSLMIDETSKEVTIAAAESSSVDRVIAFRSAHNWARNKTTAAAFGHFFDILKPGGKFGIVQHQADVDQDWKTKNIGYVGRQHIIDAAVAAGFELHAEGYFNNNPLDTKRWDVGVWQLPPVLNGLETDEEKAPYRAIGESDRMTLVFQKPE